MYNTLILPKIYVVQKNYFGFEFFTKRLKTKNIQQKLCKDFFEFFITFCIYTCVILYIKKNYTQIYIKVKKFSTRKNFTHNRIMKFFFLSILSNNTYNTNSYNLMYFFTKIYEIKKKYFKLHRNVFFLKKKHFKKYKFAKNTSACMRATCFYNLNLFRNKKRILFHKDVRFVNFYFHKKIKETGSFLDYKIIQHKNSIGQIYRKFLNITIISHKIKKKIRFIKNLFYASKKVKLTLFACWICILLSKIT